MMIARVQNHEVAALPYLLRLVLKFVYEKNTMPIKEIHLMQDSMTKWKKKLDLNDAMGRNDEPLRDMLQRLAWFLVEDEKGKFENRKKLFKEKGIDWRKFHHLPEAYTLAGLQKAKEVYEEYKKNNPEQEDTGNTPGVPA